MKSRLLAVILGVALASSLVAIYSTIGATSPDETWEIETRTNGGSHGSQRRSLLMKKWKARKMCPPGLDICRDEEKRKAEEIAERRNAKEEREKEEAKELEELSDKVFSSSSSFPFFSHSTSYFPSVFVDENLNFLVGGCILPLYITTLLLGCSALLGIFISQLNDRQKLSEMQKRLKRKRSRWKKSWPGKRRSKPSKRKRTRRLRKPKASSKDL